MANPGPIISALWTDDDMDSSLKLDGVITVVDALNLDSYLQSIETAHDVCVQISFADRILLNKMDLIPFEKVCATT